MHWKQAAQSPAAIITYKLVQVIIFCCYFFFLIKDVCFKAYWFGKTYSYHLHGLTQGDAYAGIFLMMPQDTSGL